MTTTATAHGPYRTNAWHRSVGRLAFSRRVRNVAIVGFAVIIVGGMALVVSRLHVASRDEIANTNSRRAMKRLQEKAVAWRSTHPLSCPTIADVGILPTESDPWNDGYLIECTATTTAVRSAGPDRQFFTADDIRYPENRYVKADEEYPR